eukprot:TRINITY_DN3169_c0_g1_i2.p1 TRINITY_DN3169_c0_g1~~TRINITY_DN3169_c0_g1_i2.p1  ORF type:complete len:403 (+),score=60.84 TRINITY_DN3169_c0_g1_i2:36-1244(+)
MLSRLLFNRVLLSPLVRHNWVHPTSYQSIHSFQTTRSRKNSKAQTEIKPIIHDYSPLLKTKTSMQKFKYWGTYGAITLAASAGAEAVLQYFGQVQGLGLSVLVATAGTALFQFMILRFMGGGTRIAKSMKGVLVKPNESREGDTLLQIVRELSATAGLKQVPAAYIIPTQELNAFAAGFNPKDSVVAVTKELVSVLSPNELKAVLAHEIGHLFNGDSRTSLHLVAMNAGFYGLVRVGLSMLRNLALSQSSGSGSSPNSNSSAKEISIPILAITFISAGSLTYLLGVLFRFYVSREREYSADACSVAFTGDHQDLAKALEKITRFDKFADVNTHKVLNAPENRMMFSHMYIYDPSLNRLSGRSSRSLHWIYGLFSTHPPTQERIRRMSQYQREFSKKNDSDNN